MFVILAMMGCASEASTGSEDGLEGVQLTVAPAMRVEPMDGVLDAIEDGADADASVPGESDSVVEMATLTAAVAVVGMPNAVVGVCQALQMPGADGDAGNAMHAPGQFDMSPKNGGACSSAKDGVLSMQIAANTRTVLKVLGPGLIPQLLQVQIEPGDNKMPSVRLLSDSAIAATYEQTGFVEETASIIVETPVDNAEVELLVNRIDEGGRPLYLDAEGNVTESTSSLQGGWAIFTNVPRGIHEVFMAHAELRCSPSHAASWSGSNDGNASILALGNTMSHSNAFDCE